MGDSGEEREREWGRKGERLGEKRVEDSGGIIFINGYNF